MKKEKGENQTRKEKGKGQIETEAPVALARLEVTELEVKGLGEAITEVGGLREAATGVRRMGEAATAGARGPASLSLPAFSSLLASSLSPTSLLLSTFLAFRRAFFSAFDKCFWRIFSLFSLIFFFQGSSTLYLLSSTLATVSSIF